MTIASELDEQIYPEGESTWGCKSGVLDVEDVKEFIKELKEEVRCNVFITNSRVLLIDKINKLAGKDLI